MFAHGSEEINSGIANRYFEQIQTRSMGKPLQHIIGSQEFMSLDFEVSGDVLIPRQDTEILVEAIINKLSTIKHKIEILDMCTGSGCIAVSLAYYLKNSHLTAVDISSSAIAVAERNALKNSVAERIEFVCSSLFEKISGKFDVIVSNPPYIPKADIEELSVEVRDFEPRIALDGGADGLDFYRRIVNESPNFLAQGGILAFETGFDQAYVVADLMSTNFFGIEIIKDLSNINRVVIGQF